MGIVHDDYRQYIDLMQCVAKEITDTWPDISRERAFSLAVGIIRNVHLNALTEIPCQLEDIVNALKNKDKNDL